MDDAVKDSIEASLKFISKKWITNILIDLKYGRKRFSDFLDSNENLSNKVLSERLKELIQGGYVRKYIINMIPLTVKYQITDKGKYLNRILFELYLFSNLAKFDEHVMDQHHQLNTLKEYSKYFELENVDLEGLQARLSDLDTT